VRLSARELSAFIGAVYEAGLDPGGAGWPAVLERLSRNVAGGGPVGLVLEHRRFEYAHAHYAATDPHDVAGYLGHYARIDPVFEPRLPTADPGEVLLSDALAPAEELRRSEFHADWLHPHGLGSGAATVLLRHNSSAAALYAVRPRRRGAFSPEELEVLQLLVPHITAAVRLAPARGGGRGARRYSQCTRPLERGRTAGRQSGSRQGRELHRQRAPELQRRPRP
jgi:GAF domain-containing protein